MSSWVVGQSKALSNSHLSLSWWWWWWWQTVVVVVVVMIAAQSP
jgi:hypothetical protein